MSEELTPQEAPTRLPTVNVGWDENRQGVVLKFDEERVKTWEMVIAILEMALSEAKFRQELARMAKVQQQAMQAKQHQDIERQLFRGK